MLQRFRDAEARIVRSSGSGQWECQLYVSPVTVVLEAYSETVLPYRPNGVSFLATSGTSEFAKRWTPRPGDLVSFKHSGFMLASKKPKHATLHRMRPDLTWQDVVNGFKEPKQRSISGNYLLNLRHTPIYSCFPFSQQKNSHTTQTNRREKATDWILARQTELENVFPRSCRKDGFGCLKS
jgi:hypothetical protein